MTFTMYEALGLHLRSHRAKTIHELQMINDADDQHRDAEGNKRQTEMSRRSAATRKRIVVLELLEHLKDREAKTDE